MHAERVDEAGVEPAARPAAGGVDRAVQPEAGEGDLERVGDRGHPGEQRDLVALLSMGVALAVPPLEEVLHCGDDRSGHADRARQRVTDVAFGECVLLWRRPIGHQLQHTFDPTRRWRVPAHAGEHSPQELEGLVGVGEPHDPADADVVAAAVARRLGREGRAAQKADQREVIGIGLRTRVDAVGLGQPGGHDGRPDGFLSVEAAGNIGAGDERTEQAGEPVPLARCRLSHRDTVGRSLGRDSPRALPQIHR